MIHQKSRLLDQVRQKIRLRHYSIRTEKANLSRLHAGDLDDGFGEVYLPYALERKYKNTNRVMIFEPFKTCLGTRISVQL